MAVSLIDEHKKKYFVDKKSFSFLRRVQDRKNMLVAKKWLFQQFGIESDVCGSFINDITALREMIKY